MNIADLIIAKLSPSHPAHTLPFFTNNRIVEPVGDLHFHSKIIN